MKILSYLVVYRRFLLIVLTPLLLLPLPLIIKTKEAECAYTLFVVAIFWLTEALPLAVSALLPAFMFPLFGIMESKEVASAYFKDFHLLLIGVICLATSIEKWNFHKRVALRMVMLVGVNPAWLMLGFMVSCAFLSMWLSNTSAAAMVMPIVEAVAQQIVRAEAEADALEMSCSNGSINLALELDENIGECESSDLKEKQVNGYDNNVGSTVCTTEKENEKEKEQNLPPVEAGRKSKKDKYNGIFKVMCLCVAYSATIGGLTTTTGTSTNLIFAEHFNTRYPTCQCINFGSWFVLSVPITVIILLLSWVWLQWLFLGFDFKNMFKCGKKKTAREEASIQVIQEEYKKLGPMSYPEIVTLVLFILMTLLWFTRDPGFIPGWSSLFPK
ncbi:PREDICTED: solute carrier family 13 member 1 [Fulmarus glacialis]|uniref:solute carrier family 13 member 1 n=1 Tax=Fulmarus glacialis TaxID=30455 RepID=UPI00051C71A6|nr:PREDICTED: solute carrier family 13 member 1 [Fulmarus glacialis]